MKSGKKIDLESLKPKPHPFREIFRRHKVTNAMLGNYLGRHPVYIVNMLGGHFPMTAPVREKLEILVRQLEAEGNE